MVNHDIACDPLDPRKNTSSNTIAKTDKKVEKKLSRKLQRVETRRKVEEMLYLQAEDNLLGDPFAEPAFF